MNYGMSESGELTEVGSFNPNGEVVRSDSGGWISGPCLTPDEELADEDDYASGPPREYGYNIVALMADYTNSWSWVKLTATAGRHIREASDHEQSGKAYGA
jgi:hypothetical protein